MGFWRLAFIVAKQGNKSENFEVNTDADEGRFENIDLLIFLGDMPIYFLDQEQGIRH